MKRSRIRRWSWSVCAAVGLAGAAAPSLAEAARPRQVKAGCKRKYGSFREGARSPASFDLYHGLAYFLVGGGILVGPAPPLRWSRVNAFDSSVRDGLRLDTVRQRRAVDLTSDIGLLASAAILPLTGVAAHGIRTRDCIATWDMSTDMVESFGLGLMIVGITKQASGRERPFSPLCDGNNPPADARCDEPGRKRSFISGHATFSAMGAGLACTFAIDRRAYGHRGAARAIPCVVGIASAITTGVLRISADRHWASDVAAGFAVGAVVGAVNTWGPLDLLTFHRKNGSGRTTARGMLMPQARGGRMGARLMMTF